MKRFITIDDVEACLRGGQTVLECHDSRAVTTAARELAASRGVRIVAAGAGGAPAFGAAGHSAGGGLDGPYRFSGRLSEADILRWREEFPILKTVSHLGNCSQSAQSKRVRAAINQYLDNWLTIGMDWDYWVQEVSLAKAEFARMIGADPEEIAITTSVSEAVSSIASALDYSGRRRKIVTTEAEFPTVGQIWLAHQKYGGQVDFIPVHDNRVDLADYERHVDEETLMTSITHVYYLNGFKQDLDAIIDICHRKGSIVLVDAYQAAGTCPIDVHKQNIDIYTTGNLKYLFGIPGVAFIYVNKRLAPLLQPSVTGWFGQDEPFAFKVKDLIYAPGTRRLETGTPPVLACFAARAGLEIVNEVGPAAIAERIDFLSGVAIAEAEKQGLKMISPTDISQKGGTTAIELTMDSHLMEKELAGRGIIASARGKVIRVAPHFYSTAGDLINAMAQIRDIAEKHSH